VVLLDTSEGCGKGTDHVPSTAPKPVPGVDENNDALLQVLIKFRTETRHENFVSLLICFMDINYR
jgi:hypothetical protein